jgi:hypothetical protein
LNGSRRIERFLLKLIAGGARAVRKEHFFASKDPTNERTLNMHKNQNIMHYFIKYTKYAKINEHQMITFSAIRLKTEGNWLTSIKSKRYAFCLKSAL